MDLSRGKMPETSRSERVSTRLRRVAQLARQDPRMVFTTLAHHIDVDFLHEAVNATRKDGAAGIDGRTAEEYAAKIDDNLRSLLERFQSGRYRAPPVLRVHIPKGDGRKTRPIGIPTYEDKVLQRAVAMVLEAVYEQDFLTCSYGFRHDRSAHQALARLWEGLTAMRGGWVVELDIQSFFDTLDHRHLRSFLDQRVRDGVIRRAIDKWLNAGVLEEDRLHRPEGGTPQGGVISPLLANIYLHVVLDEWFTTAIQPRMRGESFLVRYADDAVLVFAREDDARRVMSVLPKRFERFGLTLHPDKTKLVRFQQPPFGWLPGDIRPARARVFEPPETFELLGFTHYWGRTRRGGWALKRKTAKTRLRRAARAINLWLRTHCHLPIAEQQAKLSLKLRGHWGYYGITGNYRMLARFQTLVTRLWRKWLNRRSQKAALTWARFTRILKRFPLPKPVVTHSVFTGAARPIA